jgi:hypothetical protein
MSRQSYSRHPCDQCGGKTAGNGFARHNHQISKRHIDSLKEKLSHMVPLQNEALALSRLIDSLERDRKQWLDNRKRYSDERLERRRANWHEQERELLKTP